MSIKSKTKKIAFMIIKPFIPFIIIILGLFFSLCTIIDAIFIQEVQTKDSLMPIAQAQMKEKCIEKSEMLNTCHNYRDGELTNYLLDLDNREVDKEIQWSHLYAIMAFHNMANNTKINERLLEEVAESFESTFTYEKSIVQIETTTIDEEGNTNTVVTQETAYLLVESDTIIGHYKYNYEERVIQNGNKKTTAKVFIGEEQIGEKYERLKEYLIDKLHIRKSDIETNVEIVVQAANGYYEGEENTDWLQGNSSFNTIITNGTGLLSKDMFTWPIPGYTKITSQFGMRTHPITGAYKLHSGTDVGAPMGVSFVAMADGVIIKAAYNSAYGNMVMIDHRKWNSYFICTWFRNIS